MRRNARRIESTQRNRLGRIHCGARQPRLPRWAPPACRLRSARMLRPVRLLRSLWDAGLPGYRRGHPPAVPVRRCRRLERAHSGRPAKGHPAKRYPDKGLVVVLMAAMLSVIAAEVGAEPRLTISGLDSSRLLTRNRVDLYVGVTDGDGEPIEGLERDSFEVSESVDGETFAPVEISDFAPQVNVDEGVTFLMVVDNSGSMHLGIDGEREVPEEEQRIMHAKDALRGFLREIDSPQDRVGIASFNTFFTSHTEPTSDVAQAERLLEEIERPEPREAYTELYAALIEAAAEARDLRGRRVIILLADGANYPFARYSGESHPEYGDHIFGHDEAIDALHEEELTVHAVHFGSDQFDQYLERIADETGGLFYNARTGDDLSEAYDDIRRRVLTEYRISYRPSMKPAERRHVQVGLRDTRVAPDAELSDSRSYLAGTLFGLPGPVTAPVLAAVALLALLVWVLLGRLRFRNRRRTANFEVFGARGTRVFPASTDKTVIGGPEADVTVVGPTGTAAQEATVVYDQSRGRYTLHSPTPVTVNNRSVNRRDLEPGDVIRLSDTLVVFDEPQEPSGPRKRTGKQHRDTGKDSEDSEKESS